MELGYLLHLTHYDPVWVLRKKREKPFDFELGMEILEALAEEGFTTLFIGVSDGVEYQTHPELKRHYSLPMAVLEKLAGRGRSLGFDIVPKLNFSESVVNRHSDWMKAPGVKWHEDMDDHAGYLTKAFDCVDEVIAACQPKRFFHIGMDEDHSRSYTQYAQIINDLRDGLAKRGLRTMLWNDSAINYPNGQVYVEKMVSSYGRIPKDIAHVVWAYRRVPEDEIRTVSENGFEVWGAPGRDQALVEGFAKAVKQAGDGGILITSWTKCVKANRRQLLSQIRSVGTMKVLARHDQGGVQLYRKHSAGAAPRSGLKTGSNLVDAISKGGGRQQEN